MAAPRHAWHLEAWLRFARKKQADLVRDLEMNKAKVSLLVNQKQPYDQDDISTISSYLGIEPYELLMHPNEAAALRRLRASAEQIAAGSLDDYDPSHGDEFAEVRFPEKEPASPRRRTGTYD